ncbi:Lrp/AsnC family transcriptional regulator [Microbacterium sp. No. 7]|uniref:Lrp/AsnC family transcriptional regulator n=1 Tax=Microbacterium sp. No. 7 TaxID=1714373 RepID=UPI0006D0C021|nr:Lrp/AsnC family transcriptional regulator [Microbacterium sp. No. 7]
MRDAYDEVDLRIIHALQIAPRAAWRQLAGPLGLSAATLARRWQHIVGNGDAWVSAYPSPRRVGGAAFVEITCEAGAVDDVAASISRLPLFPAAWEMSGGRDILATARATSVLELHACVRGLRATPGVRGVQSHVATRTFASAQRWRLDALDARQSRAVRALAPSPSLQPAGELDRLDQRLMVALSLDGRAPAADLARDLGVSINTVRRRMHRLIDSGELEVRCDVSRVIAGREVLAMFWLRVPPDALVETARALAGAPSIRRLSSVTGTHNLMLMAWLRHTADLPDYEALLTRMAPHTSVGERAISIRTIKHAGRVLDDDGRVREIVPLDFWQSAP